MYVDTHLHLDEPWLADAEKRQRVIEDITAHRIRPSRNRAIWRRTRRFWSAPSSRTTCSRPSGFCLGMRTSTSIGSTRWRTSASRLSCLGRSGSTSPGPGILRGQVLH